MPVLSLKWLNLPQIIKLIKFNLFQTGLKQKIDFINYLSCVCSEKRCIKYIGHTHFTYKGWRRLSYPYLCSPWRKSDSIPAWLLFFSNITVKLTFLRMFSFVYNIGTIKMKWIRSASWPLLQPFIWKGYKPKVSEKNIYAYIIKMKLITFQYSV